MLKLKYFFISKIRPPFQTISYTLSLKIGIKIIFKNNFQNVAIYKKFKLNMIQYFFKYDICKFYFLTLSVINLQCVICQSFKNIGCTNCEIKVHIQF